ncbi:hypothetical protein NST62_07050 [Ureibacillus sp. FSL K6-8385]|uniref:hypothetical protein n=1 Tax=Ureibacillus TaxID=160795 RepID=UPI0015EE3F7D|nr:hypothetical protein [Ureibacillus terrenus]MED3662947.1 hypothetical protein [Ureibacillus terrenus]MED3763906.1 hypothetical protein [Ureibacillus terrenus]
MTIEKLNIVPVKLNFDSDSTSPSTSRGPLIPVCVIQATDLKISFNPVVKPHII